MIWKPKGKPPPHTQSALSGVVKEVHERVKKNSQGGSEGEMELNHFEPFLFKLRQGTGDTIFLFLFSTLGTHLHKDKSYGMSLFQDILLWLSRGWLWEISTPF
ncbi:hypothetical protein Droror1_Dr00024166 [Drosera rotundifolia]